MKVKKKMLVTLSAALMVMTNPLGAADAKSYDKLPKQAWVQQPNADYLPVQEDTYVVPGTNTLYLHMGEEKASQTKVWSPDTLRAVDYATGKIKWAFSFAKAGYGWPSTDDPFVYAPDGSVYAYFSSEHLLYAIGANGKERWSKQLAADVPFNGKLHRLSDGTLVIIAEKSVAPGKESVQFIGLDSNGKPKFNKVISGKFIAVTKDRIIVKAPAKSNAAERIIGYDASLKQIYQYSFPNGAYVNDYTAFALIDGTMVFPTRTAGDKQKETLIAVSSTGKEAWKRLFGGNGLAFSAGKGYLYLNLASKKLSYYVQNKLVKELTLGNFTMPEGDILPTAQTTADGKLLIDLVSRQYIMDPVTFTTIHEFNPGIKANILEYKSNTIVVHYWNENKILAYSLN